MVASLIVVMVLSIIASLLFIRSILLNKLDTEVNRQIAQESREFASLIGGNDPRTGEPFDDDVEAIGDVYFDRNFPDEGEELFLFIEGSPYRSKRAQDAGYSIADLPEFVADISRLERTRTGTVSTPAGSARYRAVPVVVEGRTHGTFVVANFPQAERQEIDEVIRVAVVVMIGVLLISCVVGWIAAGRALRPLKQLSDATRSIGESDLNRRLEVGGPDEVSELTLRFNDMLERLDAAFSAQRRLVDDAGHELRAPLTVIRGHIEMLRDDYATSNETLPVVVDELERMERMVGDLLTLAKSEQPDFLVTELVDVRQLTGELMPKVQALGKRRWHVERTGNGMIEADRHRVTQAWMQLAQNAVQQTSEQDDIWVGSEVADDKARLWVRDTGAGIASDERDAIFERFSRGVGSRGGEGAGLGLSIVAAIVAAHGGRVEVESDRGKGALFVLVLPTDQPAR